MDHGQRETDPEGVENVRTVHLKIRAGEHTCAESVGVWCRFLLQDRTGWNPKCALFDKVLRDVNGGVTGWLARCPECKEAEHDRSSRR